MAHIAPCCSFFTIATTPSTWTYVHNFFTNIKPYLGQADKNVGVFFLSFHAPPSWNVTARRLSQRVVWYSHFFCNNNKSRSVTFQHQRAGNCWMLRPRANKKFALFFLCKENFVWHFSCENKILRVFLWHSVCNNYIFGVQLVQQKYLWRFYLMKPISAVRCSQIEAKLRYLAIGKWQLNACAFSDGVEKQKYCLEQGDIKTVITFLLYNF